MVAGSRALVRRSTNADSYLMDHMGQTPETLPTIVRWLRWELAA